MSLEVRSEKEESLFCIHYPTLHNRDSPNSVTSLADADVYALLQKVETANNGIQKLENQINAIQATPFALSSLGLKLYQKLREGGITPTLNGKSVMQEVSKLSQAAALGLMKEGNEVLTPPLPVTTPQFSSQRLDLAANVADLNTFANLLPPSYVVNAVSNNTFSRDWSRILNVSRGFADSFSSFKTGTGFTLGFTPEMHFNKALAGYLKKNKIADLHAGDPEVLADFLRSELKDTIGADNYQTLNLDTAHPTMVMAAAIKAAITQLSPQLVLRNDFVVNQHINDTLGKSAVQLNTLKDIYNVWADIKQATILQRKKDKVSGIGALGASLRRMNPGTKGTSKSIVDKYTTFLRSGLNTDSYYQTFVPDEQGTPKSLNFTNALLGNDLASLETSAYFTPVSVSSQYIDAADVERLKSYEIARSMETKTKHFEDVFAKTGYNERLAATKTLKFLAQGVLDTGLHIAAMTEGGIPTVQIGMNEGAITLRADSLENAKAGIDVAARHIVEHISNMALTNQAASHLYQQPQLELAAKAFLHKLIFQVETNNHAKSFSAQIGYLQERLEGAGLHGVSASLGFKKEQFDKIVALGDLSSPTELDEAGDEHFSATHKWAVGYLPQAHQSTAAMLSAYRKTLIKRYEAYNAVHNPEADVPYSTIEEIIQSTHSDVIANELQEEQGFLAAMAQGGDRMMSQPAITEHGLPRMIQEQLASEDGGQFTPVNADVLKGYSDSLGKSYIGSVSLALEHLYRKELQDAKLKTGVEPESTFVQEEVLATLSEMRGDQYVWDRMVDMSDLPSIAKGSPIQISYNDEGGHQGFAAGYFMGIASGKAAIFDMNTNAIKFVPMLENAFEDDYKGAVHYAAIGRAIYSPFGLRKSAFEKIQSGIAIAAISPEVQQHVTDALQSLRKAQDAETTTEAAPHVLAMKESGRNIRSVIDANTSKAALMRKAAEYAVTGSVMAGYLGGAKIASTALLGLGAVGAAVAGFPLAAGTLGTMGVASAVSYIGMLGTKTLNNVISARREHVNMQGLAHTLRSTFSVKDYRQKEAQHDLQALPSFVQEEIGLQREYSGKKRRMNNDKIAVMETLQSIFAPTGVADNQTLANFMKVKELQSRGELSHADVSAMADTITPALEASIGKRAKDGVFIEKLSKALTDYGYEPTVQKWFDETGMTLKEMVQLKKQYQTGMVKLFTGMELIPMSETLSKRLSDQASLEVLTAMGITPSMSEVGKQRAINKVSQLSTGEYGNRNLLEKTQTGKFMSLYSRFRKTANAYYINDAMRNINMQSFVHDVAGHFQGQQYQYDENELGGLRGKQGTYSNISYEYGNAHEGDNSITGVRRIQEYPYLHAFEKKLKYSASLGVGMRALKYGIPLLLAGLMDDDDNPIAGGAHLVSESLGQTQKAIEEGIQYTGYDSVYSSAVAWLTQGSMELMANLLHENALEQKLEDGSWTKKEAQTYLQSHLQAPDDLLLTLGMGKGAGSFTTAFASAVYGNALAALWEKGVMSDSYMKNDKEQQATIDAIDHHEAQIVNQILGSVIGVESIYGTFGKPAIEIGAAIEADATGINKKERSARKSSLNVIAAKKPFDLITKQRP